MNNIKAPLVVSFEEWMKLWTEEDIKELRENGLIVDRSIKHRGRFGTELVLTEGYIQHGTVKAKLLNPKLIAKSKKTSK